MRYVYFREDRRPLVTLAFENAPKFVNLEEPFAPCERCSSGQVGNTLSIVRDTTSADSSSTQASSPGTKSASGQMTKQQQTLEDLKGIHGLDVQLPLRENRPTEHLYLCVATKDSFTACPIRTDLMRYDIDFFKELKSNYCKARGPWLRWLSPYRYHHCEFYEVSCLQTRSTNQGTCARMCSHVNKPTPARKIRHRPHRTNRHRLPRRRLLLQIRATTHEA